MNYVVVDKMFEVKASSLMDVPTLSTLLSPILPVCCFSMLMSKNHTVNEEASLQPVLLLASYS